MLVPGDPPVRFKHPAILNDHELTCVSAFCPEKEVFVNFLAVIHIISIGVLQSLLPVKSLISHKRRPSETGSDWAGTCQCQDMSTGVLRPSHQ